MEYDAESYKPTKLLKNRSFMSRLSTALVRSHSKHTKSQQQTEPPVGILKNKLPRSESTKPKKSFKPIEHGDTINCRTEYATICDIVQADGSSDETPPVPPKHLDELYAKVNKKVYKDFACNTDLTDVAILPSKDKDDECNKHNLVNDTKIIQKAPTSPKSIHASYRRESRKKFSIHKVEKKKKSSILKTIILQHQEELKGVKEEMKEVMNRNEELQDRLRALLDQEKNWKEEMSIAMFSQRDFVNIMAKNSELHEKITRLELETKQEVQTLCDRVLSIKLERDNLAEEMQILKRENNLLSVKYDKLREERKGLISVQTHTSELKELQIVQKEITEKFEKELKTLREKCDKFEDGKNSAFIEAQLLREQKNHLETEISNLKNRQKELEEKKEQQSKQLGELTRVERENYELILSLTQTVKDLTAEKDVLLKTSEFQDSQRRELQAAYVHQSEQFSHFEDFIADIKRQTTSQLRDASTKTQEAESNYFKMKSSYEEQLDALRNKIIEQTCTISNLSEDKKKLQQDFEKLWLTVLQHRTLSETPVIDQVLTKIKKDADPF